MSFHLLCSNDVPLCNFSKKRKCNFLPESYINYHILRLEKSRLRQKLSRADCLDDCFSLVSRPLSGLAFILQIVLLIITILAYVGTVATFLLITCTILFKLHGSS